MLLENENGKPVLWLGGQYSEKGNKTIRVLKNYSLVFCIFMSLQYFLVGIFGWLRAFFKKTKLSRVRLLLWLSAFSLILMLLSFLLTIEFMEQTKTINIGSMTVFLTSIAFFVLTLFSVVSCFRPSKESFFSKWYLRLSSIALLVLAFWLLTNGFIGLKLWAY